MTASAFKWPGGGNEGALELLNSQSASADPSIDFPSLITSDYRWYILEISDLVAATDDVALSVRTSADNGSNYDNGASDYQWASWYVNNAGSEVGGGSAGATLGQFNAVGGNNGIGNAANEGGSGLIYLYAPLETTYTRISAFTTFTNSASRVVSGNGAVMRQSAAAVNAFQVLLSSGNITSGDFRLYGVRNA